MRARCFSFLLLFLALGFGGFSCGKKDGAVFPNFAAPPTPTSGGAACAFTNGWTFDTGLDGWNIGWTEDGAGCAQSSPACFPVTLTFDGAAGDPAPGSLRLDIGFSTASSKVQVRLNPASFSLNGASVCARVRLDAGSTRAKIFVKSGAGFVWANGPEAVLSSGTWVNLTFDPANPSFSNPGFAASDIREVGVEFSAGSAVTLTQVHLDTWTYSTPSGAPTPTPTATPTPCDPGNGGWTFDADLQGWNIGWTQTGGGCGQSSPTCFPVTLTFDAGVGDAAPGSGALSMDFADAASKVHVRFNPSPSLNLTGFPICARVRLDSGSAKAKIFVKSGAGFVWANGPEAALTSGAWTTVTMDPDNPSFANPGFSAADIREVGLECSAGSPVGLTQVHFDHWVY